MLPAAKFFAFLGGYCLFCFVWMIEATQELQQTPVSFIGVPRRPVMSEDKPMHI